MGRNRDQKKEERESNGKCCLPITVVLIHSRKKRRMEYAPSGVMVAQPKKLPLLCGSFFPGWSFPFFGRCLFLGSWPLFSRGFLFSRGLFLRRFLLCGQCTHPLSEFMRQQSRNDRSPVRVGELINTSP